MMKSVASRILNHLAKRKLLRRGWVPNLLPISSSKGNDSKRVLHLLFTSLPYILNGYGVRSHSILRSQQRLGLSVLAVSRPGFPWDLKQFQHLGLEEVPHTERVEEVEYRRIADPGGGWGKVPLDVYLDRYAEHLRRVVEEVRPAVLHAASNFVNGCVAGAVGRARGIPVVYEARGFWEMTRGSVEPTFKTSLLFRCHQRLETQALEMADAVVCISEGLKREVMRRGIAAEKIQVIPNGVECQRFTPRAKDPALVAALGLEGKVVVGYLGSLVEYEGVDVLLQACAHLLRRHVPLKVLIVGEGVVRGKLEGLAREFSLGEAVCFTGRVPQAEVLRYYSVMDICPFPRKGLEICHMVTPLKPYEAMAMEKAVIVSDVEALREMVIEGETGLVCRADDAESLANAIGLLVEDRGLGERLGKEGRAWVSDQRDWGTLARRYLPVYETLGVKRANGRNTRGLGIENSDFVLF